ncbi:MAG: hypothetical protein Q8Q29_00660 [Actinomycetota bacterium]|nr:hypothetical protein [Actinomycetota bacterium]
MSLTVIGYDKAGRRIVRDDGPARARVTRYGTGVSHPMTATEIRPVAEWRPEPGKAGK